MRKLIEISIGVALGLGLIQLFSQPAAASMLLLMSDNAVEQHQPKQNQTNDQQIVLGPEHIQRVYDGDTFFVNLPNQMDVLGRNIGVRIRNIDTPEHRSRCKTSDQRTRENAAAKRATALLQTQLMSANKIVLVNLGRDKYFRVLASVYADGVDVTKSLQDAGVAVPYDGGTKTSWCK